MLDASLMPLLTALAVATALSAIVFTLTYPYFSGETQKEKRLASVTESRAKKVATRSAAEVAASRKKQVADSLKDIETRQKAKEKATLRVQLMRAGLEQDPKNFWIASAISAVVCAVLAALLLPQSVAGPMVTAAAMIFGGLGLPRFVLAKLVQRRQKKFVENLANAIDVVVRGVKSGLPLHECLQVIARESPEPIASEFAEIVEQQRVGVPLGEAMDRLVLRMPLPEVKFLAIVIAIQQHSGGNLSEALGNLSGVLRDRLKMSMKVKALSAEAKTSAMVLGSMPPGVMFMVYGSSPDYIMPLFVTKTGNLFILAGAFWMTCGVLVMRKMINFKF
jgi:tight adherence protein B